MFPEAHLTMLERKTTLKNGRIVTCENHSIHNGLGSAVAEGAGGNLSGTDAARWA